MTEKSDDLGVVDTSGLTDADWAEINKLKRAYNEGGDEGLKKAFDKLDDDPVLAIRVLGAFFPDMVRETIKDAMAASGVTEEDLRDLILKLDPPATKQ